MSDYPESFSAFLIEQEGKSHKASVQSVRMDERSDGDIVIRVAYSSVNYKDALAGLGKGRILRQSPLIGGIDAAGVVVDSQDDTFKAGDEVLVTGCGLSETRDGGYAEYLRVCADAVIAKPATLSLHDCMAIGTAGFTAALALLRMEHAGLNPDAGPVVVTGATGGVGSFAIDILTRAGYDAHAITGKFDQIDYLRKLGAQQCLSRHKLYWGQRPLESASWAGAIDNVGGEMLDGLTRVIRPWGAIASCGLAGGTELHTTVMPFIIRGIALLGVNSSGCPKQLRQQVWEKLAGPWKPAHLDTIVTRTVGLEELRNVFSSMLDGKSLGRTLVKL